MRNAVLTMLECVQTLYQNDVIDTPQKAMLLSAISDFKAKKISLDSVKDLFGEVKVPMVLIKEINKVTSLNI